MAEYGPTGIANACATAGDGMTALASLFLAMGGFAALALAMQRHARAAGVAANMRLRWAGATLLVVSLGLRLIEPGWRIGAVEWTGQAALAAACVVLALLYRPRVLPPATLVTGGLGIILTVIQLAQ